MLDLFPEDPGDDSVWIPRVAAMVGDWIVLSGDRKLLTSPQNRTALSAAGLSVFVMPPGFPSHDRWDQASKFFKYLRNIVKTAEKMKQGDFFSVHENGGVTQRD